MGRDEYQRGEDLICSFCAQRGYGEDTKQYLLGRAKARVKAFDDLKQSSHLNSEHRFEELSHRLLEEWIFEMEINPLFP